MVGSPPSASAGGRSGSRRSAHSAKVNSTTSTVYARPKFPPATMNAPSSGPTTNAMFQETVCRTFAAGSSSTGTRRGMIAERAGLFTANPADCSATRP